MTHEKGSKLDPNKVPIRNSEFRAYCEFYDPVTKRLEPVYAIGKDIPWIYRDSVKNGKISLMPIGPSEIVGRGSETVAPSFWRGRGVHIMPKDNEIIFTSGKVRVLMNSLLKYMAILLWSNLDKGLRFEA